MCGVLLASQRLRVDQPPLPCNRVATVDTLGFVAREFHGHRPRHPGALKVANCCASEVVWNWPHVALPLLGVLPPAETGADAGAPPRRLVPACYTRRSPQVTEALPWLLLKGLSTGDFVEALTPLLGTEAAGLPPSTIVRLTARWAEECEAWRKRSLGDVGLCIHVGRWGARADTTGRG
jgi:hypothetical protein